MHANKVSNKINSYLLKETIVNWDIYKFEQWWYTVHIHAESLILLFTWMDRLVDNMAT